MLIQQLDALMIGKMSPIHSDPSYSDHCQKIYQSMCGQKIKERYWNVEALHGSIFGGWKNMLMKQSVTLMIRKMSATHSGPSYFLHH
jgi:hypothetical protein